MIPDDLLARYVAIERIAFSMEQSSEIWVVEPWGGGPLRVLKLVAARHAPSDELLEQLRDHAARWPNWPVEIPEASGYCRDGRYYTVQHYHHAGSLAELDNQYDAPDRLRQIFSDVLTQILALHNLTEGPVVHGDIKPSNILVRRLAGGSHYGLSDFDSARRFDRITHRGIHPSRYTSSYAAPEVLSAGEVTPALDFWSLGMTLLVLRLGHHPLDGLYEAQQRALIGSDWRPGELDQIDDVRWRALLSGLLDRNATSRWGSNECDRWLKGDDSVIARGLALLDEQAAETPLRVGRRTVFSARTLAEALLSEWRPEILDTESLASWLRNDLRREDIVELLSSNVESTPEMRLLRLCHALHPSIPALWRDREISSGNIIAAAEVAAEQPAQIAWLRSLLDSDAIDFFAAQGNADCIALQKYWIEGWRRYEDACELLISAGAPSNAQPLADLALPEFSRIAASPSARQAFDAYVATLFSPQDIFRRAPWFLHFGSDSASLSIGESFSLSQFAHSALLVARRLDSLDELETLELDASDAPPSYVLSGQGDLLEDFTVPAGAEAVTLTQGNVHRFYRVNSTARHIGAWWHKLGAFTRSALERLRLRVTPKFGELPPDPTQLHINVQLLPLSTKDPYFEGRALVSAQLARVSWRFPERLRVRLRLSYAGALISPPMLTTPPILQHEGSLILVLTRNTRIQLFAKHRWYGVAVRTEPLDILFSSSAELRQAQGKFVRIDGSIHNVLSRIRHSDDAICAATEILSPSSGGLHPVVEQTRCPAPTRLQIALHNALSRYRESTERRT